MNDALSNPFDSPLGRRGTSSEQAARSTSWNNESTKRALKGLRGELSRIPEVAAYTTLSRSKKHSWPDLLFAAVTMLGGIGLVIHGSNQNLLESLAGTVLLVLALSCVAALNHEGWHRHLSASERVNDILSGWILSPLLVADFEVQQRNHLQHHAYLGEDADPDGQLYRMSTKTFVLMLLGRAMVIPYLLKVAGLCQEASANRAAERLLRGSSLLRIALVHGIWFIVVSVGAWLASGDLLAAAAAVLFGHLLPLMLASFMIAIRGHREHYVDEVTAKTVTCDTDCVFIERWLIAGGRFNWHACHHLFPEIPQRRLPQLGKLIRRHGDVARHYDDLGSPIAARASYFSAIPDRRMATLDSTRGALGRKGMRS
jgi:fatty acid desaturase